jgi:mRNA interferase YafQ
MRKIVYTNQFKKDFKKLRSRPLADLKVIFDVICQLEHNNILGAQFKDHALIGNWSGFRECHIKPDLLLIYRQHQAELQLARLGSHSDLF